MWPNDIIEILGRRFRVEAPVWPGSCRNCVGRETLTLCEMLPTCSKDHEDGTLVTIIYVEVS